MRNSIHETVLGKLQAERKTVAIFTINGYQMKGRISAYAGDTVVLQDSDKQMIVYKSAISTIVPESPVDL